MTSAEAIFKQYEEKLPLPMIRYHYLTEMSKFLQDDTLKQGKIVEIGCAVGGTTIRLAKLAEILETIPVYAIDIWQNNNTTQAQIENISENTYLSFKNHIKQWNVQNSIKIIKNNSHSIGKIFDQKISLLILDGNHKYEEVKKDLQLFAPKIIHNGYIFMDDYAPWDNTTGPEGAANDTILANNQFNLIYKGHCAALLKKNI